MSLTKNEILERIENGLFEYYISKDDNEDITPLPDHLQTPNFVHILLAKAKLKVLEECIQEAGFISFDGDHYEYLDDSTDINSNYNYYQVNFDRDRKHDLFQYFHNHQQINGFEIPLYILKFLLSF